MGLPTFTRVSRVVWWISFFKKHVLAGYMFNLCMYDGADHLPRVLLFLTNETSACVYAVINL